MAAKQNGTITEREIAERTRERVQARVSRRVQARRSPAGNTHDSVDEQIERMVGQEANATPDAPGQTADGDGLTNDQIRRTMEGRRQELYLKGIADRTSGRPKAAGGDPVRAKTRELMRKLQNRPLLPDGGPAVPHERPPSPRLAYREFQRRQERDRERGHQRA